MSQVSTQNPKVVHLCHSDHGGAGKAAYRLHKGLLAIGVDSTMLVVHRKSDDPTVKVLPTGNVAQGNTMLECGYDCPQNEVYGQQLWQHWVKQVAPYQQRQRYIEIFSDTYCNIPLDRIREIQQADIINFHWMAGTFDYRRASRAFEGKQIVWTMHDMNPATGGCHYSGPCKGYKGNCGECKMLASTDPHDISSQTWHIKKEGYSDLKLTPVSPSNWLAQVAQESSLLAPFKTRVIANGFPETFTPSPERKELRESFQVPDTAKVILFGAESLVNERKGFNYLIKALTSMDTENLVLAYFGKLPPGTHLPLNMKTIDLGFIDNETTLATMYSLADVFVIPSIEDNLPNTVVEAMLCGVPVVGFNVGGIPDMVEHKKTGYVAPARDVKGLIDGINWCLFHPDAVDAGKQSRDKAVKCYNDKVQAKKYLDLYLELVGSSPVTIREEKKVVVPQPPKYRVSAIVSTYNAEAFLRGKLEDLEAQTIAAETEIIVIDSGSQQNERAIVEEFQSRYDNIRYLRTENRETVYQAWNRGVRMATGEFITNANTDDRLRKDAFEVLADTLTYNPDKVLAYGNFRVTQQPNETFDTHTRGGYTEWGPYDRFSLLELCCIGPFPMWRRSLHDAIGFFDERYKSAADYEFWLRASLGHAFIHVPEFLGLYYMNDQTVSRNGDLPTLEYLQIQKLYRRKVAPTTRPVPPLPEMAARQLATITSMWDKDLKKHALLNQFIKQYPQYPAGYFELAELHYKAKEMGMARKHYEKAAILDPRAPVYTERLDAFQTLELSSVLKSYLQALSLSIESKLIVGMLFQLLDLPQQAIGYYRDVLSVDSNNVLASENLRALQKSPITWKNLK